MLNRAQMPHTSAYFSTLSPPEETSLEMLAMMRVMAEPPASALMPSEDRAPASPRMSAFENFAVVLTPARRRDMFEMSFSVVARWLPRSTIVEP